MNIGKLASRRLITIGPHDPVERATALLDEHYIHHLPVVTSGTLVGIISDRDLLLSAGWRGADDTPSETAPQESAASTTVAQVMHTPVVTLSLDAAVREAAQRMIEKQISALPLVTAEGKLQGLVTRLDLLERFCDQVESEPTRAGLRQPVSVYMRAKVYAVAPNDTLDVALQQMRERRIRHLPVLEDARLVGIISDRDLRRAYGRTRGVPDRERFDRTLVKDVMSVKVHTVLRETPLARAAEMMIAGRVGALPVIEDRRVAGIITDTDIIRLVGSADH